MVVCDHHPEPPQRLGGDPHAELGNVPLEERPHKVAAPLHAGGVAPPRLRAWESPPAAEPPPGIALTSRRLKPPMVDKANPPASDSDAPRTTSGEALPKIRNLAPIEAVGQRPQHGKEPGSRWISSMMTSL